MTCEDVRKLVAIGAPEDKHGKSKSLRAHLEQCEACRAFEARMRALDEVLALWEAPDAPETIPAQVSVRLASWERPLRSRRWQLVLEKALAPVVVAVGLGLGVLLGSHLGSVLRPVEGTNGAAGFAADSTLIVDPLSGSFTEAVATVAFAGTGR